MAKGDATKLRAAWGEAGIEPALQDVLADPLVHLVMQRDGVSMPALRAVVAAARARLRQAAPSRVPLRPVPPRRGLCCGLAA